MSIQTWIEEFYPTKASAFLGLENVDREALEHSLQKWIGLRKENMEKHGVFFQDGSVVEFVAGRGYSRPGVHLGSSTCALCQVHYSHNIQSCGECPLVAVRGVPCDERHCSDSESSSGLARSPYAAFCYPLAARDRDPEPMIKLIQLALERLDGKPATES